MWSAIFMSEHSWKIGFNTSIDKRKKEKKKEREISSVKMSDLYILPISMS